MLEGVEEVEREIFVFIYSNIRCYASSVVRGIGVSYIVESDLFED